MGTQRRGLGDVRGLKNGPPTPTARQREVLELVATGKSNREIASLLKVSENGVKAHIARLLVKFDVPNRAALVRAALPGRGETAHPAPDLYPLLHETLSEVVGRTATEALLRRAYQRAVSRDPQLIALRESGEGGPPTQWSPERGLGHGLRAILRELWPLLIDISGPVLVARLERRGFGPGGESPDGGWR